MPSDQTATTSADVALDLVEALVCEHGDNVHTDALRYLRSHIARLRAERDGALTQLFEAEAGEDALRQARDRVLAACDGLDRNAADERPPGMTDPRSIGYFTGCGVGMAEAARCVRLALDARRA